jgi:SAM-dependent methyltransferase
VLRRDTDRDWGEMAARDPYYAVLTDPRFRQDNLDSDALSSFFRSGEVGVEHALSQIRRLAPGVEKFDCALDFGCGVGRLLIPMARRSTTAIGVDVATNMLSLCRTHCDEAAVKNVVLFGTIEEAVARFPSYDWVNSFIVFQHIPPSRGLPLVRLLLEHLAPGGFASLHFAEPETQPIQAFQTSEDGTLRTLRAAENPSDVLMSMFDYDLSSLFAAFVEAGFSELLLEHTDHGGCHGAIFLGRKRADWRSTQRLHVGQRITIARGGSPAAVLGQGWGHRESWGAWTTCREAVITLHLAEPLPAAARLVLRCCAFVTDGHPRQRVDVMLDGEVLERWAVQSSQPIERSVELPAESTGRWVLQFMFRLHEPEAPSRLGISADKRVLGLGVHELWIAAP